MESIKIKGKTYYPVNERIKAFRAEKQGYGIVTKIIDLTADSCTMQATVYDPNGFVLATGTAREERMDKTSLVNATSFVENCETSCVGRALALLGYGIDESFASADELVLALTQQGVETSKNDQQSVNAEISLEEALNMKTSKGTPFSHLTDDQLQYIVDKSSDSRKRKGAKLVLDDRAACADLIPLDSEPQEGLPF